MSERRVAYAPGEWVAISHNDAWALVQVPLTDQRILSLWESLLVSADQALDDLLSSGIRSLPGFVVLEMQGDGLRCLVREPARVHVESSTEARDCEGTNPWLDTLISPVPTTVTVYGADGSTSVELPMLEGIVSASHLVIQFSAKNAAAIPTTPNDQPVVIATTPDPVEIPQAERPASVEPMTAAPAQVVLLVSERVDAVPDGSQAVPEVPQAVPPPAPVRPQSTYHKLLSLDTIDRQAFLSQLRAEEEAADQEPVESANTESPIAAAPEPAAPSQPVSAKETSAWSDPPEEASAVPWPTAGHREPKGAVPTSDTGVTDGVPWMTGGSMTSSTDLDAPPSQPPAPTNPLVSDLYIESSPPLMPAELAAVTTSRAALLRQLTEDVPSGPTVFAYRCSDGHLSPTTAVTCRVCNAHLAEQEPIRASRPVLGRLKFSNGLTVMLDRSVIFGRDPRPLSGDAADRPNLIRPIDSGELSRMHASVTLDGWQLLLRDLGSTHGTFLTLPGGDMNKLRANEDYPLEPGSVVSLAEIVSFTYEPTA